MWLRIRDFLLLLSPSAVKRTALFILLLVLIVFPIGMLWVNSIDDDLNFAINLETDPGESKAVDVAIALINREVNQNHWTPSDPFFMPGAWLDRMPAFQRGIIDSLSRFGIEMADQVGRTRGSSEIDRDLDKVSGLLKYQPDVWIINPSVSYIVPTASSEKQYRGAMKALQSYNRRLASGNAVFERRSDNLQAMLERIALDIGSSSAALHNRIVERPLLDTNADVELYSIKGKLYAYAMLLDGLHEDFGTIIREKQLEANWQQMRESLYAAAALRNYWVFNNAPDSQFLPNHLTAMGFYLLRARTQLKEISNILLK